MKRYLKQAMVTVAVCGFSTLTFALSQKDMRVNFSPYADLSINAHWDSTYQDMEPMDLAAISQATNIKSYHLAFITDAGSCKPAWAAQSSYSVASGWGAHLTDKLRANKVSYTIAFGGASGNDMSLACSNADLINVYEEVIKTYQPQGLDFDIENGTANVDNLMKALQQTQKNHPELKISFTLPTLPDDLTAPKNVIAKAKSANLQFSVNLMAMDYGPAYVNDMGQYAIDAANQLFNYLKSLYPDKTDAVLWSMVEITPMIGVNDVNVEQFSLTNVDTLRHFAEQNHMGGLSMWSVARDNPCADAVASPICSGKNLQTKPYEFAERFVK